VFTNQMSKYCFNATDFYLLKNIKHQANRIEEIGRKEKIFVFQGR